MEIRRSYDRLISTMRFLILVRQHFYFESGPWKQYHKKCTWTQSIICVWKYTYKITTTSSKGRWVNEWCTAGHILGLHPANERQRYFVTTSFIDWVKTKKQPCISCWQTTPSWLIQQLLSFSKQKLSKWNCICEVQLWQSQPETMA